MVSVKRSLKERNRSFARQKKEFIAFGTYFMNIAKGVEKAEIESSR